MILTGVELLLIGVIISCIGYIVGRFDKRLTRIEETLDRAVNDPNWRK